MDVKLANGQMTTSQEICYEAAVKARREELAMRREAVLQAVDASSTPSSLYVMGMLSDVQEMIARGMTAEANEILNDIKVIVDERLAKKDEHGRHA